MAKETGLICTGDSVRAFLDNRKSQTRRVMKPQPTWEEKKVNSLQAAGWKWDAKKNKLSAWPHIDEFSRELVQYCPYGQVGDRLYIRETHRLTRFTRAGEIWVRCEYRYEVDGDGGVREYRWLDIPKKQRIRLARIRTWGKWRSSRFMYRFLARIWLEITGIRVERVQEISAEDAIAEGLYLLRSKPIAFYAPFEEWVHHPSKFCGDRFAGCCADPIGAFSWLWDSLNAKRGYPWSDEDLPDNLKTGKGRIMYGNPWVWVLEVKRISDVE